MKNTCFFFLCLSLLALGLLAPSSCETPTLRASCKDILLYDGKATDGVYQIDPDGPGGSEPISVYCDMTTDGGGWTMFFQCLKGDSCRSGGSQTYYNVNWLRTDFGTEHTDTASYLIGASLTPVIQAATEFKVQITDTARTLTGHVIYPLDPNTLKFFNSTTFFQSDYLTVALIDSNGQKSAQSLKICYAPDNSYFTRSYQGKDGMYFMGYYSAAPSASANSGCDYGPWNAQMLIRDQDPSDLTAIWGVNPAATWSAQAIEHRVFVR